jgi:hypothetical protein
MLKHIKEIINIDNIQIHSKDCLGCQRHKKDILITISTISTDESIIDLFLTQKQAEELRNDLIKTLEYNEKHKTTLPISN